MVVMQGMLPQWASWLGSAVPSGELACTGSIVRCPQVSRDGTRSHVSQFVSGVPRVSGAPVAPVTGIISC